MPQHILVVEDEPHVLEYIVSTLEAGGYRTQGVTSGQAAVERALQISPDLIVLDETLPGLHFEQVILRLRDSAQTNGTSAPLFLFMLSRETLRRVGNGAKEIAALFAAPDQRSRPEMMIVKPFGQGELIGFVNRMLQARTKSTEAV